MKIDKTVAIIRVIFVFIALLAGSWFGQMYAPTMSNYYSVLFGVIALIFIFLESVIQFVFQFTTKKSALSLIGLFFGLLLSALIYPTIPEEVLTQDKARIMCNLLFGYIGVMTAVKNADRLSLDRLKFIVTSPSQNAIIADTNILIDGRIKEIAKTKFLMNPFVVPEFVLDELQLIADSTDPQKRSRGRRGLENLEELRDIYPNLQIYEQDYPDIRDVDHKLIRLARDISGSLLTNDYNLNKIATLHKINVLNLNDLAGALKPSVYVGEDLNINILREGKEPKQGVGYLDDGTMVVVDNANSFIGEFIDVTITSILQTSAGRMVFGKLKGSEEETIAAINNSSTY